MLKFRLRVGRDAMMGYGQFRTPGCKTSAQVSITANLSLAHSDANLSLAHSDVNLLRSWAGFEERCFLPII